MTIVEAIKSGKRFKRKDSNYWWPTEDSELQIFNRENILADYEIEKTPMEFWVNVYPDGNYYAHESKGEADFKGSSGRLNCIKVREVIE